MRHGLVDRVPQTNRRKKRLFRAPNFGLAAAITLHRARREVTIPALEIEMLCCSMASCIDTRSRSLILSNSSMRQMPSSARTKAPPSSVHSPVYGSLRKCDEEEASRFVLCNPHDATRLPRSKRRSSFYLRTPAVSPTEDAPFPVVETLRGNV